MLSRMIAFRSILLASAVGCFVQVPFRPVSAQDASLQRAPAELYWTTVEQTVGGGKPHGQKFFDPESLVSKGPITKIEVHHDGYIRQIRLTYGRDGIGDAHGFRYGNREVWNVPAGERIVRIEGEYGNYLTRLQFFTDGENESPVFGGKRATSFSVTDPSGGALRTISGLANLKRHKARQRALVRATFHFGAPYFIKDIEYDLAAMERAKMQSVPYQMARMELPNRSSVQQEVVYQHKKTVTTERTLTFERSTGLTFGQSISAKLSAGAKGMGMEVASELKWERSSRVTSGQSYTNSSSQEVSWSIPVRIPPHRKMIAVSTMRRYEAHVPFTYTVAWYEGTKDNIKKEVTLPGVYEGTHIEDLRHEFTEAPLE